MCAKRGGGEVGGSHWQRLFLYLLLFLSMIKCKQRLTPLLSQPDGTRQWRTLPFALRGFNYLPLSETDSIKFGEKESMWRLSCNCVLDMGFSYSLSFRAQLSHGKEDLSPLRFLNCSSSILFTPVTLSCKIFTAPSLETRELGGRWAKLCTSAGEHFCWKLSKLQKNHLAWVFDITDT